MLIPQTAIRGAWPSLAVFVMAIMIHLLHGTYNVGPVIYGAAFCDCGGRELTQESRPAAGGQPGAAVPTVVLFLSTLLSGAAVTDQEFHSIF